MSGQNTQIFDDAGFDADVLKSDKPVLVDFWAGWCGPCRAMAPTIDAVADEFNGKLKVGKLDVDSNMNTATRYGIRGIPAFLVFKNGQVVEQLTGAMPKDKLVAVLNKHAA